MTKKFLKTATLAMFATTLLAIFASYLYVTLGARIAEGDPMHVFLAKLEEIFDYVQLSVGFATVIYAFAKFEFNDALKVFGIFCATIFTYAIVVMIPTGIYINSLDYYGPDFYYEFSSYINAVFFSLGNVLVCQIAPAMIIAAIMWKHTKERKPAPRKLISWKNVTQRGMIISCLSLALFNFVVGCLGEYYVLGILVRDKFSLVKEDGINLLLSILSILLNCVIFNIILMYLVCFFAYKIYDHISYEIPTLKPKEQKVAVTSESFIDEAQEEKMASSKSTKKNKKK